MDDLFDVFDDNPQTAASSKPKRARKDKKDRSKKRNANGEVKPIADAQDGDSEMVDAEEPAVEADAEEEDVDEEDDSKESKKDAKRRRKEAESEPVVTDTFETAQSRELAASAGLQGVPEEKALHKAPAEPARTWPFELDPFQKVAIASIQRNESVLVSAHTSAGKTVTAEYAIAQCLKNNQRVIYTSPIKALSNQKYREFTAEFGDVGLMTGDVTINPTATCLVMTTEILRSMLYRGSEIMREVAWVVFDEIHYMRDKARGVVWGRDYHPVARQAGADGIHLIVDEKGNFREDNFSKAMATIEDKKGSDPADINAKQKGRGKDKKTNKGSNKEGSDIYKIVRMIMLKHYNPVIVFSFSKRECEAYALQMSSMAFNDQSEKDMVSKVFESAIESLSEEDRTLPQIQHILPLLRRGIGVHHSGLLPILKETIEILFQENLIKVLFATETFSIGLNMPAKTVVFTSVEKFDGEKMRYLTPSEFVQMSGRAGRRGLDDRDYRTWRAG
ncbi:hypothetical protein EYC84_005793 [Monilinia fructicola]|uniref:Helicase ATP-binding domain-containing protein n=1 Tax=Monilinia fructicola TaxID=38448 RepID=A0A5M9K2U0_MONFR|nr:hypothetical protein EYC84_005793 [Monilinia fructicola]